MTNDALVAVEVEITTRPFWAVEVVIVVTVTAETELVAVVAPVPETAVPSTDETKLLAKERETIVEAAVGVGSETVVVPAIHAAASWKDEI